MIGIRQRIFRKLSDSSGAVIAGHASFRWKLARNLALPPRARGCASCKARPGVLSLSSTASDVLVSMTEPHRAAVAAPGPDLRSRCVPNEKLSVRGRRQKSRRGAARYGFGLGHGICRHGSVLFERAALHIQTSAHQKFSFSAN